MLSCRPLQLHQWCTPLLLLLQGQWWGCLFIYVCLLIHYMWQSLVFSCRRLQLRQWCTPPLLLLQGQLWGSIFVSILRPFYNKIHFIMEWLPTPLRLYLMHWSILIHVCMLCLCKLHAMMVSFTATKVCDENFQRKQCSYEMMMCVLWWCIMNSTSLHRSWFIISDII